MVPATGFEPAGVVGLENYLPQPASKAGAFTDFATPAQRWPLGQRLTQT